MRRAALPFYFYPRPPRGGRPSTSATGILSLLFLSTPSARRATGVGWLMQIGKSYFYPRPPRGGRPPSAKIKNNCAYFYPRPPRGGRPGDGSEVTLTLRFLSTPSARRATPPKLADMLRVYLFLSTPSARRATCGPGRLRTPLGYFYPRPPRGGRP